MEVYGVVYLITNTVNGKGYVGQTIRTLKERFKGHCHADSVLGRAIRHYGKKNFKLEILKTCATKEELNEWECRYIVELGTKVPNGYNIADGGGGTVGCKHTPETCAKISALLSGKNHPLFGQHLPPEYCSKISAANRGYSPFKNLVHELDERHLSYSALARLMDFSSHKHVSLKMCGKIIFTERDKAKLVEIFDKPIEYLLARDDG